MRWMTRPIDRRGMVLGLLILGAVAAPWSFEADCFDRSNRPLKGMARNGVALAPPDQAAGKGVEEWSSTPLASSRRGLSYGYLHAFPLSAGVGQMSKDMRGSK